MNIHARRGIVDRQLHIGYQQLPPRSIGSRLQRCIAFDSKGLVQPGAAVMMLPDASSTISGGATVDARPRDYLADARRCDKCAAE